MKYDFDAEVDRRNTNSIKWEFIERSGDLHLERTHRFFGDDRSLPMWVADMDFPVPVAVGEALVRRAKHPIYGYTAPTGSYYKAVTDWMKGRHGWDVSADWISITPGVVPALNLLIRAFVPPGGGVLVQPPVYYPFFRAIENNSARLIRNPLILRNGRYTMDFEDLDEKTRGPHVGMAILSNPHNPVGRVWSEQELVRFGEICLKNDVLIVADEVHGDLIYTGHRFIPFAGLRFDFAGNAIVCTSASKTFNMAGLQTSNIVIPDEQLRSDFKKTLNATGLYGAATFGVVATEAAYNHGEDWLEQVLAYLEGNLRFLEQFVDTNLTGIRVVRPEGTFLVWLDCRGLGLDREELRKLMFDRARICLDDGFLFGDEGDGFERINIVCPRSILTDALERIRKALDGF